VNEKLNAETMRNIEVAGRAIASALEITGPFNIQFLAKENQVYVIYVNLRASRPFPFLSKVTGVNFIELFVDALFSEDIAAVQAPRPAFTAVKAPQFSFSRLTGADPILRVEMSSTGEVACFGEDLEEAYLKAILATGGKIPRKGIFISLGGDEKKVKFVESARLLATRLTQRGPERSHPERERQAGSAGVREPVDDEEDLGAIAARALIVD